MVVIVRGCEEIPKKIFSKQIVHFQKIFVATDASMKRVKRREIEKQNRRNPKKDANIRKEKLDITKDHLDRVITNIVYKNEWNATPNFVNKYEWKTKRVFLYGAFF